MTSMEYRPCHNNDKVELVPFVAEVTIGAKNSKSHHLYDHLHRKENEDAIIQYLIEKKINTLKVTSSIAQACLFYKSKIQ